MNDRFVLAIDTSFGPVSAALANSTGEIVAHFEADNAPGTQAETLPPRIAEMFSGAGVRFDRLDRIAVTVGPGAFTDLLVLAPVVADEEAPGVFSTASPPGDVVDSAGASAPGASAEAAATGRFFAATAGEDFANLASAGLTGSALTGAVAASSSRNFSSPDVSDGDPFDSLDFGRTTGPFSDFAFPDKSFDGVFASTAGDRVDSGSFS